MGLIQEFKEFAVKGNVMDLAVGIIIGAAFTKIVNSLVTDIIMPPVGLALGGVDFRYLVIPLKAAVMNEQGVVVTPPVEMRIGQFANILIEFLIVAMAVFLVVKVMNRLIRKREAGQPV